MKEDDGGPFAPCGGMARPLRLHVPGVAAHVVSRGNDKRPIFLDANDYDRYLVLLARGLKRFGVKCHATCLLWNHLHLVLTPADIPIWRLMHQVNSAYCSWFNERHGRVGHVLQGRYGCRLVEDRSYFLNVIRYVALNPVKAGKVRRAEDWLWGSYRALLGLEPLPDYLEVSELFYALDAETEVDLRGRLRAFVETETPGEAWHSLIYGSDPFVQALAPRVRPHRVDGEYSYEHRYATRPDLTSLLGGTTGMARDVAMAEAFLLHGYRLADIASGIGEIHPSTVWRRIQRMVEVGTWISRDDAKIKI